MPIRNLSIKKSLSKGKLATNIKGGKKKSQKQFSKRVNKRNRSKRNKRKRGGGNSIGPDEIKGCIKEKTEFKYNELGKDRAKKNRDRDPDGVFVILKDLCRDCSDASKHILKVKVIRDNKNYEDLTYYTYLSYIETNP